jgi:allantoinase
VVFDPEAQFAVTEDRLYFRHPVSPYLGSSLMGAVRSTYLRGQLVFRSDGAPTEDRFPSPPSGREWRSVE